MARLQHNTSPSQITTNDIDRLVSATHEAQADGTGAVCSCGASATGAELDQSGVCPLGMPWVCFRQMVLPFDEPIERRTSRSYPRACNTGVAPFGI